MVLKNAPSSFSSAEYKGRVNSRLRDRRGQVIIEYILLMVISMGIATIIMKTLVSKNTDSPGALLSRWQAMVQQIGADDPNKSTK